MNPDPVLLARLVRPQGRHGELLAEILTDFPARFAERRNVLLLPEKGGAPRPMELERHWLHKGRVVLKFKGIDSINDAEPLRGAQVAIPASERAQLEEGAFYIGDLIGCRLLDGAGGQEREVGRIVDVQREPRSADLLVIDTAAKEQDTSEEVLVPFVKAYLTRVDLEAKEVVMRLPEGLLTINAPMAAEERPGEDGSAEEPENGEQ
jgi:16S rRNA processing protein RimM